MKPIRYLNKLEGKSNAHLFHFDDGNAYVVKFFQPGFEKSLPNEWIGYCLGRYLQLPIPYGRILNLSMDEYLQAKIQDDGKAFEEMDHKEGNLGKISSQEASMSDEDGSDGFLTLAQHKELDANPYQFASLYIPNCFDGHQQFPCSPQLVNSTEMAQIILFDYWVGNQDRTRKNILFQEHAQGNYTLWAIDQAEILGGYQWKMNDLEQLPEGLMKSTAHQIIASYITSEAEFYEQLEMIQNIPTLLIEEIVDLIPDEWGVTKAEKKGIVHFLLYRRRKVLPKQIAHFIKKIYRPLKGESR